MRHDFKFFCIVVLATCLNFLPSLAQSSTVNAIVSGGITRSYRLYVPDIYDGTGAVPLVLNLHGLGSNAIEQEYYGDFRSIADTANFILVAPDGTNSGLGGQFWNAFGLSTPDDIGFISDLIDEVSSNFMIDQSRIYSTGMSNGGFMSYTLACELSNRITAIASVTGSMTTLQGNLCTPSHPVPVMQIHGTADGTVSYNGGSGLYGIEALVDYWVESNGCNTEAQFEALPDINATDGCTAEHYVYSGGIQGSTVEFYKILGGDHSWPGASININTTNLDFNASKEIWRFFSQYDLDQLTSIDERIRLQSEINVYPNPSADYFFMQLGKEISGTMSVYNEIGLLIVQENFNFGIKRFEVDAPGVYFITVKTADQFLVKRIVKY